MTIHTSARRGRAPRAALALLAALLAGCAGIGSPSEEFEASDRPARTGAPADPVPSASTGTVGEVPEDLLDSILADAAVVADNEVSEIEIVRAEAVTWSDGSLDCPEPGMLYTQALVDGYHVVLEVDGIELDYRATASGDFRRCEDTGRPSGG
jgi:hypothetical protein